MRRIIALFLALSLTVSPALATSITLTGAGVSNSIPPAAVTYGDNSFKNTNCTACSFAGLNVNTASSDRYIVAAFHGVSSGSYGANPVSSVTIGGVAATLVGTQLVWSTNQTISFWIAAVPTGTTATVVVNVSSTDLSGVGVWSLTGLLSSTATATGSTTTPSGGTLTVPLNVSANGAVIAFSMAYQGTSFTWTNATENFDVYDGVYALRSGASATTSVALTGQNFSSQYVSSVGPYGMMAAAFR